MSDKAQWISVVCILTVFGIGFYFFYSGTKPECPTYATAKFTRSGWYCTVPPLAR